MTDAESSQLIHRGCGGELLVEVELRGEGYQPRFYFECQDCGDASRWNPGGWS